MVTNWTSNYRIWFTWSRDAMFWRIYFRVVLELFQQFSYSIGSAKSTMVRSYQLPSSFSLLHSFCSSSVTLNASLTCHTIFNHLLMEVKFCLTIGVEEVTTKALLQIPMTFIMHFTLCQPTDIYILEVLSCFFWYLSTLLLLTSLLKRHLSLKGTRGHN